MIYVAIGVFLIIFSIQFKLRKDTRSKINQLSRLFPKDGLKYEKEGLTLVWMDEESKGYKELSEIIHEINAYLSKNEGTADFSILMNMVERKISMMYSDAVSKISFPTYFGLLGTFAGVCVGLIAFNIGLNTGQDGNTAIEDYMVGDLIWGVIVSMATSVVGLIFSIELNWYASDVRKDLDRRKNELYHFLQTELMPELGTDMVSSIAKLRKTINLFQPAFNQVIDRFQSTFDTCTTQFGNAFRENVQVVAQAVTSMGENINRVNDNIRFQQRILDSLKSKELNRTLDKFVSTINQFDELSQSLALFEQSKSEVIFATQELTNAQRSYNQSLSIPTELVSKVNQLLDRIKTFEDNLNQLGEDLKQSDVIGNEQLNLIRKQLEVLKEKNVVASGYVDSTTEELIRFFESQKDSLKGKTKEWNQTLIGYGDEYEAIVTQMQEQMKNRWNEFISQMDKLFDTSEISMSLDNLKQLQPIYEKIKSIELKLADSQTIERRLSDISTEVANVNEAVNSIPTIPVLQSSAHGSNVSTGNMSAIQQSIQGLERRMDVVSDMNKRIDDIKHIVERIKLPQVVSNPSPNDNMQYQQRLIIAQDKIKRLQTELDSFKQNQGETDVTPVIEELKQQLARKEEELIELQNRLIQAEKPWYKRILGR